VVLYDFETQQVKDLVRKELAELYANKKMNKSQTNVGKEQAADDLVLTPSVLTALHPYGCVIV
jgi:hypothetical protein